VIINDLVSSGEAMQEDLDREYYRRAVIESALG
jgi:hypothetical protein